MMTSLIKGIQSAEGIFVRTPKGTCHWYVFNLVSNLAKVVRQAGRPKFEVLGDPEKNSYCYLTYNAVFNLNSITARLHNSERGERPSF